MDNIGEYLEGMDSVAFYKMLDEDAFASYLLDEVETLTIEEKEVRIADYCERESLKGAWQGCMDLINEWVPDYSEAHRNFMGFCLTFGFVLGYLCGKVEEADSV